MNAVKQEEEIDLIDINVKVEYLMDIKCEEGFFFELNVEEGGVGGYVVGVGEVFVMEVEVEEVVEEEVVVDVKRKVKEETKPRKKRQSRNGWVKVLLGRRRRRMLC